MISAGLIFSFLFLRWDFKKYERALYSFYQESCHYTNKKKTILPRPTAMQFLALNAHRVSGGKYNFSGECKLNKQGQWDSKDFKSQIHNALYLNMLVVLAGIAWNCPWLAAELLRYLQGESLYLYGGIIRDCRFLLNVWNDRSCTPWEWIWKIAWVL